MPVLKNEWYRLPLEDEVKDMCGWSERGLCCDRAELNYRYYILLYITCQPHTNRLQDTTSIIFSRAHVMYEYSHEKSYLILSSAYSFPLRPERARCIQHYQQQAGLLVIRRSRHAIHQKPRKMPLPCRLRSRRMMIRTLEHQKRS